MDEETEKISLLERIARWFGRPKKDPAPEADLADTAPLSADNLDHIPSAKVRESLEAGAAQSIGLERENNEDSVFIYRKCTRLNSTH